MFELVRDFEVDSLMYMVVLLLVIVEKNLILVWDLNMGGLMNVLEVVRIYNLYFFILSLIGVFGDLIFKVNML